MSVREQLNELMATLPDYKLAYVLAYVQGMIAGGEAEETETPNAETPEAIQEVNQMIKEGIGEHFTGSTANFLDQLLAED